ncbi:MAG: deoxyribodipyrimidine photo-lyase [Comamonadaceae bacterium]|nr:MAG: deoxyribodipyrimidine photo-lyase [Comamonadaceae bacterium]
MDKPYPRGLMWFRRDLRSEDNAALYHALKSCRQVLCVFVFDTDILGELPKADRRVEFIRESLAGLSAALEALTEGGHGGLIVTHASACTDIPRLAHELGVQAVFANHDYEPAAIERDARVFGALANEGVAFRTYKDQVIFEREELLTQVGKPYSVFTPYKNAWLKKVDAFYLKPYPVGAYAAALMPLPEGHRQPVPSLQSLGFEKTNLAELKIPPGASGGEALLGDFLDRIDHYGDAREFPAVKGCSYLGVHNRFGTISIRKLAATAHRLSAAGSEGAAVWLSELIWRDFFFQILFNFPHVVEGAFRPEYDKIKWEHGKHADALFKAWCEGRTGYPLVDAAMAQINQTGFMHNRLRMVVASFLIKDLGIHWQRGEAYFAELLNDYDLSANNGNWQWAASSGCDAQPWFRIFSPVSQSQRFDAEGKFIRRYLPQLSKLPDNVIHEPWLANPMELLEAGVTLGKDYPEPIVVHAEAREKSLARYGAVKKKE